MELEMISTFINTVGFPAAAFAAMWYLNYKTINAVTTALKDLEVAITEMVAKFEKENKEGKDGT